MVELVCPDCTVGFHAHPGSIVSCPACGFRGGRVPGALLAPEVRGHQGAYTPFQEEVPGQADDEEPETARTAVTALVLGLCFFVPPAGIVAIMFGLIALGQIKDSKKRAGQPPLKGRGTAIAGIVLGAIFQLAWFILVIMALAFSGNIIGGLSG